MSSETMRVALDRLTETFGADPRLSEAKLLADLTKALIIVRTVGVEVMNTEVSERVLFPEEDVP